MPNWLQHIFVLLMAAGAAFVVARQAVATLRGRGGKIGSCCAKGCDPTPAKPTGERIAFLPAESLTRSRRS